MVFRVWCGGVFYPVNYGNILNSVQNNPRQVITRIRQQHQFE